MNLTSAKYYREERQRLAERREAVSAEIASVNAKLTHAGSELALLDDLIGRLDAHLPPVAAPSLRLEASA